MKKLSKSIFGSGLAIIGIVTGLITPVVEATPSGTSRVSTDVSGNQANSQSQVYDLSEDGRYVLLLSYATNLVAGDTNGKGDLFVKDTNTGSIERVTVSSSGTQGNGSVQNARMSSDGRFVVFASESTNLVASDANGTKQDVFIRDRSSGSTELISKSTSGTQSNDNSEHADVSDDGRFVVFASAGTNLIASDTNAVRDVFVHDRTTGATDRVSESSISAQGNGLSQLPRISCDGRFISFNSQASNLVASDTNGFQDVILVDRLGDLVTNITASGNNFSAIQDITCNGELLAFESYASNLVSGDTNAAQDTFRYERSTGTITRVSLADDESEGNAGTSKGSMSTDGRYIAFLSFASNLIASDTNAMADVFIRDTVDGTTERMNVSTGGAVGTGNIFNDTHLSRDAHYVAYGTDATNLVAGDTNAMTDVFKTDTGYTPLACY